MYFQLFVLIAKKNELIKKPEENKTSGAEKSLLLYKKIKTNNKHKNINKTKLFIINTKPKNYTISRFLYPLFDIFIAGIPPQTVLASLISLVITALAPIITSSAILTPLNIFAPAPK